MALGCVHLRVFACNQRLPLGVFLKHSSPKNTKSTSLHLKPEFTNVVILASHLAQRIPDSAS